MSSYKLTGVGDLYKAVEDIDQRIEKLETRYDQLYMQVNPVCQPKPHYTRGQEVEVFCSRDYENWWEKALYMERLKEDVHLVFIEGSCKLGQFPGYHIKPLQTTEG